MPVYIENSGDLVGCYHSGTTTNEQTRKDRATHYSVNGPWKAEMSNFLSGSSHLFQQIEKRLPIHFCLPQQKREDVAANRIQDQTRLKR